MAKLSTERGARGKAVGRSVGDVAVLKEASKGGMRKLRCPKSQQIAVPTRTADGSLVYQTPNGVRYKTRKM